MRITMKLILLTVVLLVGGSYRDDTALILEHISVGTEISPRKT